MSLIVENELRVAHFTSSEAWRLMTNDKAGTGFGAQGLSYIEEKNAEIKLGRSIDLNKSNNTTAWGEFMEKRVHDLLPTSYELLSSITLPHPKYPKFWSGSQDNVCREEKVVCDTKCYEPYNFSQYNDVLIEAKKTGDLSEWKKEYPKEYWQLVSNACIWGFDKIEVISYMPYESELEEIRAMAENYIGEDPWRFRFIYEGHKSKLPYLPDGNKFYKNLNIYRFDCPLSDKQDLEDRMVMASKKLVYPKEEKSIIEQMVPIVEEINIVEMKMDALIKSLPPISTEEKRTKARKKLEEFKPLKSKLIRKHEAE